MSDKKFEEYKKELEQIEVPKELKEKTIARMKEQALEKGGDSMPRIQGDGEKAGDSPKALHGRHQHRSQVAAAAALLLIGVGAYIGLGNKEDNSRPIVIAQQMEAGSVSEEVELSDGNLVFSKIPTQLQSFGMQMGVIGEETATEEGMHYEYEEDEEYEGVGYEIISVEGAIPYEEESQKLTEGSGLIGDVPVRAGYYKEKDQTIFVAYFMAGDMGYKVKGIGVTQEEFVQKVLSIAQEK